MILTGKCKEKFLECKNCLKTFSTIRKKLFCSDKCCDKYHSSKRGIKKYDTSDLLGEIWIDVKDYEGFYQVSNLGRVKSLDRIVLPNKFYASKILKGSLNKDGYRRILLYKNSKYKGTSIHRLVATHFIDNPENKPCINHINGIRNDNRVENLEWVTYSENERHAYDVLGKVSYGAKKKPIKKANEIYNERIK